MFLIRSAAWSPARCVRTSAPPPPCAISATHSATRAASPAPPATAPTTSPRTPPSPGTLAQDSIRGLTAETAALTPETWAEVGSTREIWATTAATTPAWAARAATTPGTGTGTWSPSGTRRGLRARSGARAVTGTAPGTEPSPCGKTLSKMAMCLWASRDSPDTIRDMVRVRVCHSILLIEVHIQTNQSYWIRQMAGTQAMVKVDTIPGASLDFPIMLTMRLAMSRDSKRKQRATL